MITDDRALYDALAIAVALLAGGWVVAGLARLAGRRRPGLHIGAALGVAAAARVVTAGLFAAIPSLRGLRGPDEASFLALAGQVTENVGALGSMPDALIGNLHVAYMALWQFLFDSASDVPLRVAHIALSLAAIAVMAVAVADLAGVRAGVVTAWVLALEPSNVFFSGILHKEAPMLLGEALVILGAVWMYQRREPSALLPMLLGLAIAGLTRPYAGAALAVACMAICMHAALRRVGPRHERAPLIAGAVIVIAAVAMAGAPSPRTILGVLQASQNANVTGTSNLRLEPIDYSSVGPMIKNIGRRVRAVLLQPYPWQVANESQRFGVLGSVPAWSLIAALLVLLGTRGRAAAGRLPPLLYVLVLLTLAYALSTGNAGTGFRYRTHLLVVVVATATTLAYAARSQRVRYGSKA